MSGIELVYENVVKLDPNGRRVIDGANFEVDAGEHVALVGKLGSGKVVLLELAAALLFPEEGHVFIDGTAIASFDYADLQAHRIRTGYAFRNRALLVNTTIFENIALPLRYHKRALYEGGLGERAVRDRVTALLRELGIEEFASLIPAQVHASGLKRALIARALVLEPSLLLIDEPRESLIQAEQELVEKAVESRRAERGMTVLQTDHEGLFGALAPDRLLMVEEGKVE